MGRKWGMEFNEPKCKIMHVGNNNPGYSNSMSGESLKVVEEEKFIGITVHGSLKPSKHCKKAAGIAGAVLRQLERNFHYRDRNFTIGSTFNMCDIILSSQQNNP